MLIYGSVWIGFESVCKFDCFEALCRYCHELTDLNVEWPKSKLVILRKLRLKLTIVFMYSFKR